MDIVEFLNTVQTGQANNRVRQEASSCLDSGSSFPASVDQKSYVSSSMSTTFGAIGFDAYYSSLFHRKLDRLSGSYIVHCLLNFAVQQLATRTYSESATEKFVQIGGFDDADFAAAIIGGMPHTTAIWVPADTNVIGANVRLQLDATISRLAADDHATPTIIDESIEAWLATMGPAVVGTVCIVGCAPVAASPAILGELHRVLNAKGRIIIITTPDATYDIAHYLRSGWAIEARRTIELGAHDANGLIEIFIARPMDKV